MKFGNDYLKELNKAFGDFKGGIYVWTYTT